MGAYDFIPGTKDYRDRLKQHVTKKYSSRELNTITHLAVHHSLTNTGSAESFARYHVNTNDWPGIGYHFVIEKSGTVKWCHDLETKSYHVGKSNSYAVGICLVGDFRSQVLEEQQLLPLIDLLRFLLRELSIPAEQVQGHSEFPGYDWKACPCFDMEAIRNRLNTRTLPQPIYENEAEFVGPRRPPKLDLSFLLDPNILTTHPGESVLQAVNRFASNDLGLVKKRNKQLDISTKKQEAQVIKVRGPVEVVPEQVQSLIDTLSSLNYAVFTDDRKPYNLNIVGIRNSDSIANAFDDKICVFWKYENQWQYREYLATTDPGLTYLNDPINDDGTAILMEGQYRGAYRLGRHRNRYDALVQAKEVTVIRDFNRDSVLDLNSGRKQTGFFGINIHRARAIGESKKVDRWSAGCQVLAKASEFKDFMRLCKQSRDSWGENFTYTLIQRDKLV